MAAASDGLDLEAADGDDPEELADMPVDMRCMAREFALATAPAEQARAERARLQARRPRFQTLAGGRGTDE